MRRRLRARGEVPRPAGLDERDRDPALAHRGAHRPVGEEHDRGSMPGGRRSSIASSTVFEPPGAAVCENEERPQRHDAAGSTGVRMHARSPD